MKQFNFLFILAVVFCCGFARAQEVTAYDASGPGTCDGGAYSWNASWSYQTWDWLNSSDSIIQHEGDSIYGLCPGTYTLNYTDSTGSHSEIFTIGVNPCYGFTVSVATTDASLAGCDGTAQATVTGGSGPYNFQWYLPGGGNSSGIGLDYQGALCPGSLSLYVTDQNGCAAANTATISQAGCDLVVSVNSTTVSSSGACDATATATVSGGTAPYSYSWGNGSTAASVTDLCIGNYYLMVSDANGCTDSANVTITDACNGLSVYLYGYADTDSVNCNGGANAYVYGGTPPYNYLWSNGSTGDYISNLCEGIYTVSITDANGCTAYGTYEVVDSAGYYPCSSFWSSVSTQNTSGPAACDGGADAQVYGGTAPYYYYWSNGVTSSSISNLCTGYYTVDVTDANGCLSTASGAVSDGDTVNPCSNFGIYTSPAASTDSLSCDGGASVAAYGGSAPYTYTWSNGSTDAYVSDLCPGYYTVTVTSADGCSATATVYIDDSTNHDPCANVMIGYVSNNVTASGECDGNIYVYGLGNTTIMSVQWSNGATTAQIDNLCEGYYTAQGYDQNGCEFNNTYVIYAEWDSSFVYPLAGEVYTSDAIDNVSCNGTASAYSWGGTPPYSYLHSNGSTSEYVSDLCPGTYSVEITDANGQALVLNYLIADSASIWVNNPYPDSVVVNSCASDILEICEIDFNEVTNVYIEGYGSSNADSLTVVWAIETTSGTIHVVVDYYIGNAPDGVFTFMLSIFCPEKSIDKYLKAYDQLYLETGSLSLDEAELSDAVAYPNPFADQLTVRLPEAGTYLFRLTDLAGRVLRSETAQVSSTYELKGMSELATGRYLLQVVHNEKVTLLNVVKH